MKYRRIINVVFGLFAFITLVATVLEWVESNGDYAGIIYMIVMLYGIGIEVGVLLLLGLYHLLKGRIIKRDPGKMPVIDRAWQKQQASRRELGKTYLLCSGLILLVGFSSCLGGAYLLNQVFSN